MFAFEIIGYTISLLYNYRLAYPISTWGENGIILIQRMAQSTLMVTTTDRPVALAD
jgi:hypothetical protein